MDLSSRDIVNIERYLESCVKPYDIPYLNSIGIILTGKFDAEKYLRVSLRYDDLIKGRDIIQPKVKEIMKELFELDDIRLERCYEACNENEENLFEILYNISDKKFKMFCTLGKISQ